MNSLYGNLVTNQNYELNNEISIPKCKLSISMMMFKEICLKMHEETREIRTFIINYNYYKLIFN